MANETEVDRLLKRAKNRRPIAWIVVGAIVLIALGQVFGALGSIRDVFAGFTRSEKTQSVAVTQPTTSGTPSLPVEQPSSTTAHPADQATAKPSAVPGPPKTDASVNLSSVPKARLRIANVRVVPLPNAAGFPAVNIYYDNVGTVAASSIGNHFAVGFSPSELPQAKMNEIQDGVLRWDGWQAVMDQHRQQELYPGDPAEFTTIPPSDGDLANDFRANFDNVANGVTYLYVFLTIKYKDASMSPETVGVTEDCFWFSGGNFARHFCGRRRNFLEHDVH